jgi:hypothetical protein
MTSRDFVRAVRAQVIDERHHRFSDVFANIDLSKVRSAQSRAAIEWFRTLTPEQREIFLSYVRQSAVDAVASMLAIFDGVSYLPPFDKGFALSTGDGVKLDGDLSDLFLEAEELAQRG